PSELDGRSFSHSHCPSSGALSGLPRRAMARITRWIETKADRYCFVTMNYQDFSVVNGDRRQPHPDFADIFEDDRTRYVYGLDELRLVLEEYFGDEFTELSEETEFFHEEPRTFAEILEAEEEFFDKVWYVRSIVMEDDKPIPDDIREGMLAARA